MSTTTKPKEPTNKPTDAQIAEWKEKYKDVHLITTEDGSEAYVREPRMVDLEIAMGKSTRKNAKHFDFQRALYRRIKLWESDGLMEDEERELEVLVTVGTLGEVKEASLKKL